MIIGLLQLYARGASRTRFERTYRAAQSLTTYVYYCTIHGRQQMSGIVAVR